MKFQVLFFLRRHQSFVERIQFSKSIYSQVKSNHIWDQKNWQKSTKKNQSKYFESIQMDMKGFLFVQLMVVS